MLLLSLKIKLSLAIALYHRVMAEDLLSWCRRAASKLAKDRECLKRELYNEKLGESQVAILPAAIVQHAGRAARLWCLVRSLDHPDNWGTGSGLVRISIAELCQWLNRSERSVWRYLKDSLDKGYLYSCHCEHGELTIEYRGLKSLCKHLGLSHLGAIGIFPLKNIEHAKAHATDIQLEKRQAQSHYRMKENFGRFARGAKTAAELLEKSASSARVPGDVIISRGHRLLYLAPHWRPFGGSQQSTASSLGVSVRTVQYRVSNAWRKERGIDLIEKIQSAHQVHEECPKQFLMDFMRLEKEAAQRHVFLGSRLFRIGCNLYDTGVLLRCQRFRQQEYQQALEACYKQDDSLGVLQADYKALEEEENLVRQR